MKVSAPEHQNKNTLSTMLLELQFSMELSQLETVLSCYQELFAFFLQYWFLLKNREIASQGGDFALKEDELTTPDPARDGTNWLVYCAANPVGRWDPTGLGTLDDFAYQQRTEASAAARKDQTVQNAADALAATGQSKIAAKDIYYGNQKMTQALSVAVVGNTQYLDDKTRQSLQGKSAAEIEATLDQVTYVFGISQADVDKTIASLRAAGIDIDYPVDGSAIEAFSIAGYVFVFKDASIYGTQDVQTGKFNLSFEQDKYLLGHEQIHQLQSKAWGGPSSFLAEYNRQFNESAKTHTGEAIYHNIGFEIDAYTFGPENRRAKTRIGNINPNGVTTYKYISW